jgi:phosphopantothenoylcysteine decarboxylase/phosphopantothenate--cysteine ligase
MLAGKRILLIISGGIAAYKSLDLIRRLRERGADVRCVLTRAAKEFVTPLSVGTLSKGRVYDELFDLTAEHEIGHIRLARDCDLVVVAPATADLLAKAAAGAADDLLTTLLLCAECPVLLAPAMNSAMWAKPAVQRNVERLAADGLTIVAPQTGWLSCRQHGAGRMAEPEAIATRIAAVLADRPRKTPS